MSKNSTDLITIILSWAVVTGIAIAIAITILLPRIVHFVAVVIIVQNSVSVHLSITFVPQTITIDISLRSEQPRRRQSHNVMYARTVAVKAGLYQNTLTT